MPWLCQSFLSSRMETDANALRTLCQGGPENIRLAAKHTFLEETGARLDQTTQTSGGSGMKRLLPKLPQPPAKKPRLESDGGDLATAPRAEPHPEEMAEDAGAETPTGLILHTVTWAECGELMATLSGALDDA